ncbi:hypothetical protein C3H79_09225 [Campylobacter jejuni]|nr:hypothetical protein C3H79_09225 [Campylobacter jejuni]
MAEIKVRCREVAPEATNGQDTALLASRSAEFEGVKGLHPLQARHLAQVADSLYPSFIGRGYSL